MKTSVVISSYNGAKFIYDQLESIRVQTVPVDEVIIIDDCSTDNTSAICQNFINQHSLSNWLLIENDENQGFLVNFQAGFKQACGDLILIADQDDIWCNNKVERIVAIYQSNPQIKLLSTAYSSFNSRGIIYEHAKVPNRKINSLKLITIPEFCQFHYYMGMTIVFKKELIYEHYEECCRFIPYDIGISLIAAIQNGLFFLDEVLVKRREHYSATVRIAEEWSKREFEGDLYTYYAYRRFLNLKGFFEFCSEYYPGKEDIIFDLKRYYKAGKLRYKYLKDNKIKDWFKAAGCVNYIGMRTYILDGLHIFKSGNKTLESKV